MNNTSRELQFLAQHLVGPCPETAKTQDCPEGSVIWDAAAGDLEPATMGDVVDHVARCSACAHELKIAYGLTQDMGELKPPVHKRWTRPSWQSLTSPWLQGATAALFPLSFLILFLFPPSMPAPNDLPVVPASQESASMQRTPNGLQLQLLVPDGQPLFRQSFDLSWSALPDARYEVHLTDLELQPVAMVWDLEQPSWRVPTEHLVSLPPGSVLLWQVSAFLPDGQRIDSATRQLALRENPSSFPQKKNEGF